MKTIKYKGKLYVESKLGKGGASSYPPEILPIIRLLSLMKITKTDDGWQGVAVFSEKKENQQERMETNWDKIKLILEKKPWKLSNRSEGYNAFTETGGNYSSNYISAKHKSGVTIFLKSHNSFRTGTKRWELAIKLPATTDKVNE